MGSPVIDLSHHNPEPDWDALRDGGVVGVIHKATQGTSFVDEEFAGRRERAVDAGIAFLSYHYLEGGDIQAQMQHYLDVVKPVPGERLAIDHEADATLDELVEAVIFLLAQRQNYQVTVYSGHLIKEQLGDNHNLVLALCTSLWIAQYGPEPEWPSGTWSTWSLWQWTDEETVPGISAPVDGDRWNGSDEALLKWLAPAGSAPGPTPEPRKPVVTIMTGDDVRIFVNGEEVDP
jgi:lysozyme